jgi:molybdopterin adenylyltransferase
VSHHAKDAKQPLDCVVLVVSDSRSLDSDESGKLIAEKLDGAGHRVLERVLVRDEIEPIASAVRAAALRARAIVLTGGTGITPRDVTPEAVQPLLERELPGFGEAFRRISFDEIGPNGLLSRAFAGAVGTCVVFALPGSKRACATAMELVLPLLPHASGLTCRTR